MAASALSLDLVLTVVGGDANPAMRGDGEEGRCQKQEDEEDVGEVSLSQATLPRRAASRSRSPSQTGSAGPVSAFETLESAVAQLNKCVKEIVAAGNVSHTTRLIQLQMGHLQERDKSISLLLDVMRRCPSRGCPARPELEILVRTQEREVTALKKEVNALQNEIAGSIRKDDDEDPPGSSSD